MAAETRVRGHEFHWSLAGSPPQHLAAYRVVGEERVQGFCDEATVRLETRDAVNRAW